MKRAPVFCLCVALLLALAAAQLILPDREVSPLENRVLSQAPKVSADAVLSGDWGEALERYTADQLPLRDSFVSLYTLMEGAAGRRLSGGVLLGADDRLFDRSDGWSERNVRQNAAALTELGEQAQKKVWLLCVPSAVAVYPEALPALAPVADEEALLRAAGEETALIGLLPLLQSRKEGEALYYRTDHHWTAAGADFGYEAICGALGISPREAGTADVVPGFYGSFYARYPLPWLSADELTYQFPAGLRLLADGTERALVDETALAGRDKYAALLSGNHARLELLNPDGPEGELLVIKDSYANALLPLLARHYRRIVAVDARYFAGDIVEEAKAFDGEDIVCVYGMSTLATGRTIALLEGL
ncbi:MAG: hypothetical protein IJ240_09490 [Clostridia bacterium]|nr:hypothetical protein [Clostridia bacterium]